jgi:Family of unknown function (DUF5677)
MTATSRGEQGESDSPAMEALASQVAATGGFAVGPLEEEAQPGWVEDLIGRFNSSETSESCPHLRDEDEVAIWTTLAPDLLACRACVPEMERKIEARLGHTLAEEPSRCSVCSQEAQTRGVSLAAGRYLLRAFLCADCGADEFIKEDLSPLEAEELGALGLPRIRIDLESLEATEDRQDFDEKAWELLGRVGRLTELLIDSVNEDPEASEAGLGLDQAVVGGLLVRCAKQTRAIFDSTQAEESEAHSPLLRCLAETTATLRWLVQKGEPDAYSRFRAASFARWNGVFAEMAASRSDEDDNARILREKVEEQVAKELEAAGLNWEDIPKHPHWGPNIRQQFEDLGQGGLYNTLFATHSSYVHPSWHEIRSFHLKRTSEGLHLDPSYSGLTPIAAYVVAQLVAEASAAAASVLPHGLDPDELKESVRNTVRASKMLALSFSEFSARGGLDDEFHRVA